KKTHLYVRSYGCLVRTTRLSQVSYSLHYEIIQPITIVSLPLSLEPHPFAITLMFLHLSTLDRRYKTPLNCGSLSIVRHLPGPCLRTPAFRAASSSGVHFCLGAPISY
ncbi:ZIP metal ion transporter family, partial [Striga asiatica]